MRFEIRVKPGAKTASVGGSWGVRQCLVVTVPDRAHGGKANKAAIWAIANALDIPRSMVTIVHGHKSQTKLIEVEGFSDQWEKKLEKLRTVASSRRM
jgi:uncharacterized protein YggU (UPF0235/DUF167 family)